MSHSYSDTTFFKNIYIYIYIYIYIFTYLWLHWVLVVALRIFQCGEWTSLYGCGVQDPKCMGSVVSSTLVQLPSKCVGSWFPNWKSNPHPLHWKTDSQPLDHQGGPPPSTNFHPFSESNSSQCLCSPDFYISKSWILGPLLLLYPLSIDLSQPHSFQSSVLTYVSSALCLFWPEYLRSIWNRTRSEQNP